MSSEKKISQASVIRLELYMEYLEQLGREGRKYVTSKEIGESLGIAAVSVRQDLFGLSSAGKPKVGYEIEKLLSLIYEVFDMNKIKKACIVGYGNLGRALAKSQIWERAGYELAAIFDNDPSVVGTGSDGVKVRSVSELFGVINSEEIRMAVIATPAGEAQETARLLVSAGIKGIWNFAPLKLNVPDEIAVENQSLVWGLITLSFAMKDVETN